MNSTEQGGATGAPLRVAVLVSGRGSNLHALLEAFPGGHPSVRIVCVVTNRLGCAALAFAHAAGVPTHTVPRRTYPSRAAQHAAIAALLAASAVDLVVLAGYDQILEAALLDRYAGRVINVHPSLLPAFGGTLHAQADALQYGVKVTGCTVHFVTAAVDAGPIIAQAAVPVLDDDSVESLSRRILEQEHQLLPWVVARLAERRVTIEGQRVRIAGDDTSPVSW
jgi:phosphoribosylglycinamide formyltransferase-1